MKNFIKNNKFILGTFGLSIIVCSIIFLLFMRDETRIFFNLLSFIVSVISTYSSLMAVSKKEKYKSLYAILVSILLPAFIWGFMKVFYVIPNSITFPTNDYFGLTLLISSIFVLLITYIFPFLDNDEQSKIRRTTYKTNCKTRNRNSL